MAIIITYNKDKTHRNKNNDNNNQNSCRECRDSDSDACVGCGYRPESNKQQQLI